MTFEIGLLLALTVAAVVLFSFEKISPDVTALTLVLALVFTKLLEPEVAFQGFGSETVIMILGLLILTAALMRTGVVDLVGGRILRFTGASPMRLLIVVMLASATLGAFMSNTASTAFFVPVVIGLAKRAKMSPRQLLLPLAFASILTSSVTLISTSTNIVVSGLMTRYDLNPIGVFELAPVGIPIAVAGLAYMTIVGKMFLIGRPSAESAETGAGIRAYLSEVVVLSESPLVGKALSESALGHDFDLIVVRVLRGKTEYIAPRANTVIRAGDVLLVEASPDDLLKVKDTAGIEIKADLELADSALPEAELGIVEVILLTRSPLLGRTLKSIGFRDRYGLQVLGISRHGKVLHKKISELPLRIGDILLIQGPRTEIAALEEDRTFRVVQTMEDRKHRRRAPVAIAIFVGVLLLATFKVLPFSVAVILGAVAAFFTKCITPEEAYRELEWKAVILIGSMLALGAAMEQTGTAKYLASLIVNWSGTFGTTVLLGGFFLFTVLLTQLMSNQAAAVVVLPIAIQTAVQLGLNPRPFAMMVAIAASCSYLTPLEPSCLMVYGPGGYKFSDFLKYGSVLTIIIGAIALTLVPRVWPVQ